METVERRHVAVAMADNAPIRDSGGPDLGGHSRERSPQASMDSFR